MPLARPAVAALVLTLVGTGCGSDVETTGTTATTTAGTTATTPTTEGTTLATDPPVPSSTRPLSDTDLPTISGQPQPPPKQPTDSFQPFTTRGRVVAPFEEGCIELVTDAGRYVLIGDAAAGLVAGDEVEVSAIAAPQLRTPCQGDPIRVSEVRRL